MKMPIKRIYLYVLQQFLPLLGMTFLICWFIVLLQFLWQSLEDLVGKGMDLWNLAQLVMCAAMYVLPIAVPLGVLLASLMTFGNLGERLELLAMKSAGIPLYTILKPVVALVSIIAVGLFWYMNVALMPLSVRMWQLMYSSRFSNPDLEIPEGVFYNGIQGYNMYIAKKNKTNGAFLDLMIYDNSAGFNNARIIRADSGVLVMDGSKTFLQLSLFEGESFQNLGSQTILPNSNTDEPNRPSSYLKEHFSSKTVIIPFDTNFKVMEDDYLKSQFVGKNMLQLKDYSDSVKLQVDSAGTEYARSIALALKRDIPIRTAEHVQEAPQRSASVLPRKATPSPSHSLDSLIASQSIPQRIEAYQKAERKLQELMNQSQAMYSSYKYYADDYYVNAREMHRKMTYPIACIIFFFIGAPLGAIIRKGGIGTPIVIAILFFVIYYMIDTLGIKKINVGEWHVWFGGWISSFVLLPIGGFLAYKASRDSASLNTDTYVLFFKNLFKKKSSREWVFKEFVLSKPNACDLSAQITAILPSVEAISQEIYLTSQGKRIDRLYLFNQKWQQTSSQLDALLLALNDYNEAEFFALLSETPYWGKGIGLFSPHHKWVGGLLCLVCPIVIPLYFLWKRRLGQLVQTQQKTLVVLNQLREYLDKKSE